MIPSVSPCCPWWSPLVALWNIFRKIQDLFRLRFRVGIVHLGRPQAKMSWSCDSSWFHSMILFHEPKYEAVNISMAPSSLPACYSALQRSYPDKGSWLGKGLFTAYHAHDSKLKKNKSAEPESSKWNMQLCNHWCKRRQRTHLTFVASCRIIRAGRTTKPKQRHYQYQLLASSQDVEKAFMFSWSSLWYDNNLNYRITIQQLPPAVSQPLQL